MWKREELLRSMFEPEVEIEVANVDKFIEIVLKYLDVLLEIAEIAEFEIEEGLIETIEKELDWTREYEDIWFSQYI